MPYPHSNADGKATLGHDSEGKKKEGYYSKPQQSLTMDALSGMLKDVYINPWLKANAQQVPVTKSMMEIQNEMNQGLITKEQAAKALGINYSHDPVVIPASMSKTEHYQAMYSYSPASTKPMQTFRIQLRIQVGSHTSDNQGIQEIINPAHSYTESEVNAMLDKHFMALKKQIIEQMKVGLK